MHVQKGISEQAADLVKQIYLKPHQSDVPGYSTCSLSALFALSVEVLRVQIGGNKACGFSYLTEANVRVHLRVSA